MTILKPGAFVTAVAIQNFAAQSGQDPTAVHNQIRKAFSSEGCLLDPDLGGYNTFKGNPEKALLWGNLGNVLSWVSLPVTCLEGAFEVTPAQILPAPACCLTLLEAAAEAPEGTKFQLKSMPGSPAVKVNTAINAWRLEWQGGALLNHSILLCREYEILVQKPVPWKATPQDTGWIVSEGYLPVKVTSRSVYPRAVQSEAAALHKGAYDRILDGLRNMPGAFKGDGATVFWDGHKVQFDTDVKALACPMDIPFDTLENAQAAAEWANARL